MPPQLPHTPHVTSCLQGALGVTLGKVEESDFVLKDLAFAAQQYAVALETNPNDFDTLYNYGLVLQVGARLCGAWADQISAMTHAARSKCCCQHAGSSR
jgi:hypothetical protein